MRDSSSRSASPTTFCGRACREFPTSLPFPGIINRDFADVKTIMARMGYAVMGTATASGQMRTIEAAQRAIASPLLEAGAIDGARGILINITGSASLKLAEVQQACTIIQSCGA
jgi:cell division protein FtsZ